MNKIGIIDYGVGNIGSIAQAINKIGIKYEILEKKELINNVNKLILPGVGSFKECIERIEISGWRDIINVEVLERKKPILGICLGMQLLAENSEEGGENGELIKGLSLIEGSVKRLNNLGCNERIPHVGWNSVKHNEDQLFNGVNNNSDFYFVHSYGFEPRKKENVIAVTNYGVDIPVAIKKGHIQGVQFHPEKSSKAGFKLLENFCNEISCLK